MTIENRLSEVRTLNSILNNLTGTELPPRMAERANLMQVAQGLLNDMEEIPEEEAEAEIRELRERVRGLVDDPKSSGKSGEIFAMAKTLRSSDIELINKP